jgi:hypothetical protein
MIYVLWFLFWLVLLSVLTWCRRLLPPRTSHPKNILIDSRGRYSLTHLQVVLWTFVILASLIAALIEHWGQTDKITLYPELLGLMGIASGSAVLSTAVKGVKDDSPESRVFREGGTFSPGANREFKAQFRQIWLQEEGKYADQVIDVTKFQGFLFTLVAVGYYIAAAWTQKNIPEPSETLVWLLGVSQAGYVGGKMPSKAPPGQRDTPRGEPDPDGRPYA